jgi:hypothetical protein
MSLVDVSLLIINYRCNMYVIYCEKYLVILVTVSFCKGQMNCANYEKRV